MKLCALLALASLGSPSLVSPSLALGAGVAVRADLGSVRADNTSVESNLSSFGIDPSDDVRYPKDSRDTGVHLVSMTEWAYSDNYADGYGLYVILYNPSETIWDNGAWECTLGFPSSDVPEGSVSGYDRYPMTFLDSTSNNRFLKFFVDGGSFHSRVSSVRRRYVLGSVTAFSEGVGKSSSLGQVLFATGYGDGMDETSLDGSTLKEEFGETRSLSVPVVAFTSKLATFQTNMHIDVSYPPGVKNNDVGAKSSVNAYSVLFALPGDLNMGSLYQVHYDYYKYRTNWLLITDRKEFYDSVLPYSSKSIAWFEDGSKAHATDFFGARGLDLHGGNDSPEWGFRFQPIWDLDDRSSLSYPDESLNPYSSSHEVSGNITYLGIDRFYNNNRNGNSHWNLRVPSFGYVWYLDDDMGLENHSVSGDQILQALDEVSAGTTSVDGLPRKNGRWVNPDFAYVPSYSRNERFYKYGENEWTMSSQVLAGTLSDFLSTVLDGKYTASTAGMDISNGEGSGDLGHRFDELAGYDDPDDFWSFYWGKSVDEMDSDWDYHGNGSYLLQTALQGKWKPSNGENDYTDMTAYNHIYGSAGNYDRLLSGVLNSGLNDPFVSDWILSRADSNKSGVEDFLENHSGEDVYRLTYDFGLSNTYRGIEGYSDDYDAVSTSLNFDDGWLNRNNPTKDVDVAKTDVILDFQFLDMTFFDGGEYHVLSASNDPVSSAGSVDTTDKTGDESLWDKLGRILMVVGIAIAVVLVLALLPLLFKAVGGFGVLLKYLFKGLLFIVEAVLWVPYIVLVYPIGRLAKKDMAVWPFGRKE